MTNRWLAYRKHVEQLGKGLTLESLKEFLRKAYK